MISKIWWWAYWIFHKRDRKQAMRRLRNTLRH